MLGDLRPQDAKGSSQLIRRGWIIDPDDLLKGRSPSRYEALLTVIAPARAVIEVHAGDGRYSERHDLVRNAVPFRPCE